MPGDVCGGPPAGGGLLALSGWEQGGCSTPRSAQDWGLRVGLMQQRFYLRGFLWLLWGGQATRVKGQSHEMSEVSAKILANAEGGLGSSIGGGKRQLGSGCVSKADLPA